MILHSLTDEIIVSFFDNALQDLTFPELVENIAPVYLRREQFQECEEALREINYWLREDFIRSGNSRHKVMLYYFLEFIFDQEEIYGEDFVETYYSPKVKKLIEEHALQEYRYDEEHDQENLMNIEDYISNYYDFDFLVGYIFDDLDFQLIEVFYNDAAYVKAGLIEHMGVDIDYYWDVLPKDLKKKYPSKSITLKGEVKSFLEYLAYQLDNSDLAELFWVENVPVKESKIQLIFKHLLEIYFLNTDIHLSRETMLGKNKVDFLMFRKMNQKKKL